MKKIPNQKNEMVELYSPWKERKPLSISDVVTTASGHLIENIDEIMDDNDDDIITGIGYEGGDHIGFAI